MQQFEVIGVAGRSLWTARQGSGPALVCCHGGPRLWDYLEPVAAMIDDLVTVYRYDQRSYGRSTGGPPYDFATAVADLDALRDHWGLPQWVVLGHSWGATLALAYGLAHPTRARALIYLSGTGIDASWHAEYHANRAALLHPDEQRQLADLRARLSTAEGDEYDVIERAYCELAWSTDIADRTRARELAGQLFVDGLHVNFQVNQVLGKDADHFTQQRMPSRMLCKGVQRSKIEVSFTYDRTETLEVSKRFPKEAVVSETSIQHSVWHPSCSFIASLSFYALISFDQIWKDF